MRIGFFGDSFCENNPEGPLFGLIKNFDSWVDIVTKHYKAKCTHVGQGGSSHWDVILKQFPKDIPDVCVFTWTHPSRLYHSKVRNIFYGNAIKYTKSLKFTPSYSFGLHKNIWKSAEMYFNYLYDEEKHNAEYKSSLFWFDHQLSKHDKKFIHLWSFNPLEDFTWTSGVDVRPAIMQRFDCKPEDPAPNHMPHKEDHEYLADKLIYIIDNYKAGSVYRL